MTSQEQPLNRLFVYGTLAPGKANEHFLQPLDGSWTAAKIRGILYPDGIGSTLGYPAVKLNEQAGWISGLVFHSSQLSDIWQTLDDFEGEGYARVITTANLEDGQRIETYVYALDTDYI